MILTEEEAKTKRCQESYGPPLSSNGMSMVSAGVSIAVQTSPTHCIGSACMAWRWSGWSNGNGVYSEKNPTADHPDFHRYGYCGKGVRP